jgi:predicted glycosyltransferase
MSDHLIAMYAQNGAGLGHFQRCANVAEAVGKLEPHARVVIASRSFWPAATIGLPERTESFKMPVFAPVGVNAKGERRVLLNEEPPLFPRLRSRLLTVLLEEMRPAALLVDNEPRGLQGELVEALQAARAHGLVGRVVLGMRDIRGSAEHVARRWGEEGTVQVLESLYDLVLVYGDPSIYDTASEYGLGTRINVRTEAVGYVLRSSPAQSPDAVRRELGLDCSQRLVAVTAGAGADGASLLEGYLREVAPRLPTDVASVLVTGPMLEASQLKRLTELAVNAGCRLLRSFDTVSLVHAADAVVCRGGYNSVCEAVHAGHRPAVVARRTESVEQETRANAFARLDLVVAIAEEHLEDGLAPAVLEQLESGRRSASPFTPEASAARAAAALLGT